eukprot:scaffold75251_cov34-Prasinocladus_malaysianus.AAC.2
MGESQLIAWRRQRPLAKRCRSRAALSSCPARFIATSKDTHTWRQKGACVANSIHLAPPEPLTTTRNLL